MIHVITLLAGFTIFSAALLFLAYAFFLQDLQKSLLSKLACAALLAGLSCLQWFHYLSLNTTTEALNSDMYLILLLFVPASFYYFSRFVLFPSLQPQWSQLLHLIPVIAGIFLPSKIIPPLAFMIGASYCLWFTHLVVKFRAQQNRFALELFFFGLFAVMAVAALVLGLLIPYIDHNIFYLTYSTAIGAAMFLVTAVIIVFPDVLTDIQNVAELSYANSKLKGIDIVEKVKQLENLIQQENVYQNDKLSLAVVAGMLELTAHQLSELINTQYGYGFSKFVRTQRVAQAKKLLLNEPEVSVLAVSIMTGFKSQSNFYAAFKELTSESPGNYRKKSLSQ